MPKSHRGCPSVPLTLLSGQHNDFGCFGSEAEDKLAAGTRFAERAGQIGCLVH